MGIKAGQVWKRRSGTGKVCIAGMSRKLDKVYIVGNEPLSPIISRQKLLEDFDLEDGEWGI